MNIKLSTENTNMYSVYLFLKIKHLWHIAFSIHTL